jgi:hypothetical protein
MARNYKAPLKASQEPLNEEVAEMVNLVETSKVYKRKITTEADVRKMSNSDNAFSTAVIHGIEEKLKEVSRKSVVWEAVTDQVTKKSGWSCPYCARRQGVWKQPLVKGLRMRCQEQKPQRLGVPSRLYPPYCMKPK